MQVKFLLTGALTILGAWGCLAAAADPPPSSARQGCHESAPSTNAFSPTTSRWSRSLAEGSGSHMRARPRPRSPAPISLPAWTRRSMNTVRPSISPTPACASWRQRWGRLTLRVSGTWANTTYFQNSDAPAAGNTADRIQSRAHPPAVEGCRRFLERRQCGDRHIFRHRRRHSRQLRSLDSGPGVADPRLHQIGRWQDRRGRIHE